MSLLHDREALQSWTSLVHAVAQMVDWVHFNATREAYNQILAPRVAHAIAALANARTDPDAADDVGTELSRELAGFGWNGQHFERAVSAISLLAALKNFKVKPVRYLGCGAYARVWLAVNELTGEFTVMKHVNLDTQVSGGTGWEGCQVPERERARLATRSTPRPRRTTAFPSTCCASWPS